MERNLVSTNTYTRVCVCVCVCVCVLVCAREGFLIGPRHPQKVSTRSERGPNEVPTRSQRVLWSSHPPPKTLQNQWCFNILGVTSTKTWPQQLELWERKRKMLRHQRLWRRMRGC